MVALGSLTSLHFLLQLHRQHCMEGKCLMLSMKGNAENKVTWIVGTELI